MPAIICKVNNSNGRPSQTAFLSMRCSSGDPVLLDDVSLACWTNKRLRCGEQVKQHIAQTEHTIIQSGGPGQNGGLNQLSVQRNKARLTSRRAFLAASSLAKALSLSSLVFSPSALRTSVVICMPSCFLQQCSVQHIQHVVCPTYSACGMSNISSMWSVQHI